MYLAAAGVGHIGIVDDDVIDVTNLQRQILFGTLDIGKQKAQTAKKRLEGMNPHISVRAYNFALTRENVLDLIADYDVVADGTDNFATRYLINDACVILGKPCVYAAILRFEGQVSVFNYLDGKGARGPHYRDLFPTAPPDELVPNCATAGVLGVLCGIIGSMQAAEVIKVLTGIGEPLSGRLFIMDVASFMTRTIRIKKLYLKAITELPDEARFCATYEGRGTKEEGGGTKDEKEGFYKDITVKELKRWIAEGVDFQLIDVREAYEYEIENIGGMLMPLGSISAFVDQIDRHKKVAVHCKGGSRSAKAIAVLAVEYGFDNLYQVHGGIDAYFRE